MSYAVSEQTLELQAKATDYGYKLYGLKLSSEIALPAVSHQSDSYDLIVRSGEPLLNDDLPGGRILATLRWKDGRGFTHTETATGYRFHFHGVCEIRSDSARNSLTAHLLPGASQGLVPLLIAGNTLAFLLTFEGECVLHASAVALGETAVAMVGRSGTGKSTLAAWLCGAGASLITDDILRLQRCGSGFQCVPGTPYLRLRQGATSLAEYFPPNASFWTVDARLAVRLETIQQALSLGAIVIPQPSRSRTDIEFKRLRGPAAHLALLSYGRLGALKANDVLSRQFDWLADLAMAVPVYEVAIPWGPPFDAHIARAFEDMLGLKKPYAGVLA